MELAFAVWLTVWPNSVNDRLFLTLWITAVEYAIVRFSVAPMLDNLSDVGHVIVLVLDANNVANVSSDAHAFPLYLINRKPADLAAFASNVAVYSQCAS